MFMLSVGPLLLAVVIGPLTQGHTQKIHGERRHLPPPTTSLQREGRMKLLHGSGRLNTLWQRAGTASASHFLRTSSGFGLPYPQEKSCASSVQRAIKKEDEHKNTAFELQNSREQEVRKILILRSFCKVAQ